MSIYNSYNDGISFRPNSTHLSGGHGFNGGSTRDDSVTPFTKGYFFAFFALPGTLFDSNLSAAAAKGYLLNSAIDFQPHGDRQLQTIEDKAIGGATANFIVGQQTVQDFSLTFKEYANGPVIRINTKWHSIIDPYTGGSTKAIKMAPNEYKGSVMVIQTKPIARVNKADWKETDIIKVFLYDGVFPLNDPSSAFGNGVESTERVQVPINYKFDGQPLNEMDPTVLAQALEVLQSHDIYGETAGLYSTLSTATRIKTGINA